MGEHLGRRLRLRRPGVDQPAAADRAARLGPAGEHAGRRRCSTSGRSQASAASSQPRKPTPVVATTRSTGRGQHLAGGGDQLGVVRQRHDADRGRVDDPCAAAVEQRAELLLAAGRGDRDGVAGQGQGVVGPARSRSRRVPRSPCVHGAGVRIAGMCRCTGLRPARPARSTARRVARSGASRMLASSWSRPPWWSRTAWVSRRTVSGGGWPAAISRVRKSTSRSSPNQAPGGVAGLGDAVGVEGQPVAGLEHLLADGQARGRPGRRAPAGPPASYLTTRPSRSSSGGGCPALT